MWCACYTNSTVWFSGTISACHPISIGILSLLTMSYSGITSCVCSRLFSFVYPPPSAAAAQSKRQAKASKRARELEDADDMFGLGFAVDKAKPKVTLPAREYALNVANA